METTICHQVIFSHFSLAIVRIICFPRLQENFTYLQISCHVPYVTLPLPSVHLKKNSTTGSINQHLKARKIYYHIVPYSKNYYYGSTRNSYLKKKKFNVRYFSIKVMTFNITYVRTSTYVMD